MANFDFKKVVSVQETNEIKIIINSNEFQIKAPQDYKFFFSKCECYAAVGAIMSDS